MAALTTRALRAPIFLDSVTLKRSNTLNFPGESGDQRPAGSHVRAHESGGQSQERSTDQGESFMRIFFSSYKDLRSRLRWKSQR
jgi:hypothetical protein